MHFISSREYMFASRSLSQTSNRFECMSVRPDTHTRTQCQTKHACRVFVRTRRIIRMEKPRKSFSSRSVEVKDYTLSRPRHTDTRDATVSTNEMDTWSRARETPQVYQTHAIHTLHSRHDRNLQKNRNGGRNKSVSWQRDGKGATTTMISAEQSTASAEPMNHPICGFDHVYLYDRCTHTLDRFTGTSTHRTSVAAAHPVPTSVCASRTTGSRQAGRQQQQLVRCLCAQNVCISYLIRHTQRSR